MPAKLGCPDAAALAYERMVKLRAEGRAGQGPARGVAPRHGAAAGGRTAAL